MELKKTLTILGVSLTILLAVFVFNNGQIYEDLATVDDVAPSGMQEEIQEPPREPQVFEYDFRVNEFGYNVKELNVSAGDTIILNARSNNGEQYGFTLGGPYAIETVLTPEFQTITFVAEHPGVYTYYNHIPGSPQAASIQGTLRVE